jgi:hypothetical protein
MRIEKVALLCFVGGQTIMNTSRLIEEPDETTDIMRSRARVFGLKQLIGELLLKNQVLRERLQRQELPFSDLISPSSSDSGG